MQKDNKNDGECFTHNTLPLNRSATWLVWASAAGGLQKKCAQLFIGYHPQEMLRVLDGFLFFPFPRDTCTLALTLLQNGQQKRVGTSFQICYSEEPAHISVEGHEGNPVAGILGDGVST